jgi:hypothetical protein
MIRRSGRQATNTGGAVTAIGQGTKSSHPHVDERHPSQLSRYANLKTNVQDSIEERRFDVTLSSHDSAITF